MSDAALLGIGIDAGSTTTKVVAVDAAGTLRWHRLEPTDPRMEQQTTRLLAEARQVAGDDVLPAVATGYGRALVSGADRKVTEITCHARGVHRALGRGGTLVDIGGQDSKIVRITDAGRVEHFAMNDKCAAGTGRFLEVVAGRLGYDLDKLSAEALAADGEVAISSTCTVFAESEMISLIARGHPVEHIVRGLVRSLVKRVSALARSTGVHAPLMISGGVAHSAAVRTFLGEELKLPVELPPQPQLMGAYGAALIALGKRKA